MSGKIFMIVLCGAADRPIASLGNQTPLEAAITPFMDSLAARGAGGLVSVVDRGICPGSDVGLMALLGANPARHYPGRGALEALGLGLLTWRDSAVAFRIDLASLGGPRGEIQRRTARDLSHKELDALVRAIREDRPLGDDLGVDLSIVAYGRRSAVVCLRSRGRALSAEISGTDPAMIRRGPFSVAIDGHGDRPAICLPLDDTPAAELTADVVNRFIDRAREILCDHDVNVARRLRGAPVINHLLIRDPGRGVPDLVPFEARYGRGLTLFGQSPAEKGLCRLFGGVFRDARQGDGCSDEDYYGDLAEAAAEDPAEVVVVHLEGPDEPGHDGEPLEKARAIERIDRHFFGPLLARMMEDDIVIVTSDHATPCEVGAHTADRVPVLVAGGAVFPDGTKRFCEREAGEGGLPVTRAPDLLDLVTAPLPPTSPRSEQALSLRALHL